jgi:hypothetical protein
VVVIAVVVVVVVAVNNAIGAIHSKPKRHFAIFVFQKKYSIATGSSIKRECSKIRGTRCVIDDSTLSFRKYDGDVIHFSTFHTILGNGSRKPAQETSVSNTSHYCLRIFQKRVKTYIRNCIPLQSTDTLSHDSLTQQ